MIEFPLNTHLYFYVNIEKQEIKQTTYKYILNDELEYELHINNTIWDIKYVKKWNCSLLNCC